MQENMKLLVVVIQVFNFWVLQKRPPQNSLL